MQTTELQEFLRKLRAIGFNEKESNCFKKGEWKLHYRYEGNTRWGLQIVITLTYMGETIKFWGGIEEDNMLILEFIQETEAAIHEIEYKTMRRAEKIGKEIYDSL